jgi:hypothetical protein
VSQLNPVCIIDLNAMSDPIDNPELVRPYPFKVRLRLLETVDSYERRLLAANFQLVTDIDRLVRIARKQWNISQRVLRTAIVAAKGGIPATSFEDVNPPELRHRDGGSCISCRVGTGDQWMCRLCAHGDSVALRPHLEKVVCTRHRLWVGSGAAPEKQFEVDATHLAAEAQFQRLRRKGLVDANTLWELLHVVDPTLVDEAEHRFLPAGPFPTAVRLWTVIASREFASQLFDPNRTYAESFLFLQQQVAASGLGDGDLAVRVWHYLRPTALTIREAVRDQRAFEPHWEHDFWVDPDLVSQFQAPIRPLEPFIRYLEASGNATITAANWREVLTHRSAGHGISFVRRDDGSGRRPGICAAGHRITIKPVREAGGLRSYRCDFCNGRKVSVGETDVTVTNPSRAAYFDHEKNAPALVTHYMAGTETRVWWVCPEGHSYERSVKGQCTVENPCPVCDHLIPLGGFNTFADTHPHVAAEWHPTLNAFSPADITARSSKRAWFVCPTCSEPYETRIGSRVLGHACMRCKGNGSALVRIADRFPELASQWISELNDGLQFADAAGLTVDYVWRCSGGHEVRRPSIHQARYDCGICRGSIKLDNVNALLEKYPLLVPEFHSTMNAIPLSQMNAHDRYWWQCRRGHLRQQTLHNRRFSAGCPECPRPERAGYDSRG